MVDFSLQAARLSAVHRRPQRLDFTVLNKLPAMAGGENEPVRPIPYLWEMAGTSLGKMELEGKFIGRCISKA